MGTMDGKIALVTGGTSGIGKAIAEGLKREGARVILLARDTNKAKQAGFETIQCDVSSQASIRKAAAEFLASHPKLDVLVNCAGVFVKEKTKTADGLEKTFAVNYLAYFLLSNLLLDALKQAAPSRIINVASKTQGTKIDLDDLNFEKRPYSYLKATPPTMVERQMLTVELAERLKGTGVVVNSIHPGLVANTTLLNDTGGFFRWLTNTVGGTPEKGADSALWLATAPEAGSISGKLIEKRKPIKLAPQAMDPAVRKRLWDESARLTKLA